MKLLLTTKEAADAISMSEGYIKKALRMKELPKVKHGRCTRIDVEDLKAWNARRKLAGTPSDYDGSLAKNGRPEVIETTIGVRP